MCTTTIKCAIPLYEARTNREFESAILTALGEVPAGMYPLSEEQKLYNIMAGTTVICDDGVTYEPLLTITQEDIDAMGVEGQPQQGRITLQEFKEKGVYQVERKQGDNFGFIAYKDFVDDPVAHPLATDSGKFEIYCQYKADILNQAKLRAGDEWKPYPTYVTPVEGIETTYADFEDQVKGDFPYLCTTRYPQFRQRRIRQHQVSGRGVCHTGVHGREGGEGRTVSPRATRFWWRVLTEACFA